MTQREINNIADLLVKKDRYEALQIARGKMPAPGEVRPEPKDNMDKFLMGRLAA